MPSVTAATLAHSPLEPLVQKAGGTMVARHGWLVAAHYGSPGGEIALCDRAVGLADRSDLGKLELRGEEEAVEQLVGQLTGGQVLSGEALLASGAWWCAVSGRHVIALCDASRTERLRSALGEAARWTPGAAVTDLTPRLAALGLLGPATEDLLEELSSSEPALRNVDPPACHSTMLAAIPVLLLRASANRAVVLTDPGRAAGLWSEIERAGRDAGLGHVGADAVAHFSPLVS
jgi:glycine cleavage system aminomethyltransferase T